MMGNLSTGLKSHAVTMFEVGKLSDESLDSCLAELEKVRVSVLLRQFIAMITLCSNLISDSEKNPMSAMLSPNFIEFYVYVQAKY